MSLRAFFIKIFSHAEYESICSQYESIVANMSEAYSEYSKLYSGEPDYEFKEEVVSNVKEIESIHREILRFSQLAKTYPNALAIFQKNHKISKFFYKEKQLALKNYNSIQNDEKSIEKFVNLIVKESGKLRPTRTISKTEIVDYVVNKLSNFNLLPTLTKTMEIASNYPKAFKVINKIKGSIYDDMVKYCLSGIPYYNDPSTLCITETFITATSSYNKRILNAMFGFPIPTYEDITKEGLANKKYVTDRILHSEAGRKPLTLECDLDDRDKKIKALFNSKLYGDAERFTDSFTYSQCYDFITKVESYGKTFDEVVRIKQQHIKEILEWKKAVGKAGVFYIDDYYLLADNESALSNYLATVEVRQQKIADCKQIQNEFPHGFEIFCKNKGWTNYEYIPIKNIDIILASKEEIKGIETDFEIKNIRAQYPDGYMEFTKGNSFSKDYIVSHKYEIRSIQERLAESKQTLARLKQAVSSWNSVGTKFFSLYNYYPTTCEWEANEHEWSIRNLIWDFKANPTKPMSEGNIISLHKMSVLRILPKVSDALRHYFGSEITKLTLVCIPSSKAIVTERRYKDFSEQLCSKLGMSNGYNYIKVSSDGDAKHLGGGKSAQIAIDKDFFKGKYVLLFDDVITSGRSINNFAIQLGYVGANVVGAISIGHTRHERQSCDPIDLL